MGTKKLSWLMLAPVLVCVGACSAGNGGTNGDGGTMMGNGDGTTGTDSLLIGEGSHSHDVVFAERAPEDATVNLDAYFYMDPPAEVCYPDGGMATADVVIGGTAMCPADKNLPGCPCVDNTTGAPLAVGTMASCFEGPRADRNRGICRDGMTTCMMVDEVTRVWGPCTGEVLPEQGATMGSQACGCFSHGTWHLDNLSPCFVCEQQAGPDGGTVTIVSTCTAQSTVESGGTLECNSTPPMASDTFSNDTLTVDCPGTYHLCFTIKAGDFNAAQTSNPSTPTSDCVVGQVCVDDTYPAAGAMAGSVQTLPPLGGWTGSDATCAQQFYTSGGYAELSVVGTAMDCTQINVNNGPFVFQRVNYCPFSCNDTCPGGAGTCPSDPTCNSCSNGASGGF